MRSVSCFLESIFRRYFVGACYRYCFETFLGSDVLNTMGVPVGIKRESFSTVCNFIAGILAGWGGKYMSRSKPDKKQVKKRVETAGVQPALMHYFGWE